MPRVPTRERFWDLLRRAQGVARLERRHAALGVQLESALREHDAHISGSIAALHERVVELERRLQDTHDLIATSVLPAMRAIASEETANRARLWEARESPEYELPFGDPEPLVSVVIPTLDRPQLLVGRALPSVLAQSHRNIEVLVIGDCSGPEVERAVSTVDDPRVSFHNLSQRLPPSADPRRQWCVASVMARNEGLRRATGLWYTSFDDDDEMHPDSISRLLAVARERRAEVAYGRFCRIAPDGRQEVGEFPPQLGHFGWQTAICHGGLRFFERELVAASFDTPNDFFLAEAMLRAGVRFTMIPDVVCDYYPSNLWQRGSSC